MKIDKSSDIPIYIQICDSIAEEIINGYRSAGEKLPPRRRLADELGVAQRTVDNAYGRLLADGYITSRVGSGYYVSGDRVWEDIRRVNSNVKYNFSMNGVETSKLPFAEWSRLTRSTIKEDTGLFQHGEKQGEWRLRKSIRRLLFRTRGIKCKTEQIVIGPGGDDVVRELFMVLGRGSTAIMNNCCNLRVVEAARSAGIDIAHLDNDFDGLITSGLDRFDRGVLFQMPVHDLPTGATLPEERIEDIVSWAGDERYVIEDGSGYTYTEKNDYKTLWERLGGKNVIYIDSFSNTIAPSMKIAYFVASEDIVQRLFKMRTFYSNRVSRIEQVTLSKFIDLGHYATHVGYMRKVYREKLNALTKAFQNSTLGDRVQIYGTDTGLFCIMHFDIGVPEEHAYELLSQRGIKVRLLSQDLVDKTRQLMPQNTYVVGFGELKISEIKAAVGLWEKAWKRL